MDKTQPRRARIARLSLGYLAGSLSQALADRLRTDFVASGVDLTHAQFVLLLDLYGEDGLTQSELAARVFKDKSAVKRTLDLLASKGLVERAPASRNAPVRLTPLARSLEERLRSIAQGTVRRATRGIEPERLEICLEVLRDLQARLEVGP